MFGSNTIRKNGTGGSDICDTTSIEGNVFFNKKIFVSGSVKGNLMGQSDQCEVYIRKTGKVTGDIRSTSIHVDGQINGKIVCRNINIYSNAKIKGDIYYEVLQMQQNSVINGKLVISTEHARFRQKSIEHKPEIQAPAAQSTQTTK